MSKAFAGVLALDRMDFDVRAGEVHALVGQNGSGKSTLIKCLSGYHAPEAHAEVLVEGQPLAFHDGPGSQAAGFRFVHQDLGLIGDASVVENLAFGRGFQTAAGGRIKWGSQRRRAQEMLDGLGYAFDVRRTVDELSAAERTGVAIARALADWQSGDAKILVLDEPTASLPTPEVKVLFSVIRRVQARGLGVIYVSHRLDEIFAIAQRVSVLRDGRKVGTYDISELDERKLISLMIGGSVPAPPAPLDVEKKPTVLSVEGLSGKVVQDVDLVAHGGEVLGIAGLTGSGREEILNLLFGAVDRTGVVKVEGKPIRASRPRDAMSAGIALVPSDRHRKGVMLEMSVAENATITDVGRNAGALRNIRRRTELREVREWLESLDVRPPRPELPLASLSGGNQQKIVIAKWLRMNPRVLLLDEPTQGIDVEAKAAIHELLRQEARKGTAVVLASSEDEELFEVCDRVVVMRDGRAVAELHRGGMSVAEIGHLCLDTTHRTHRDATAVA